MDLERKAKIRQALINHRAAQFAFLSELIAIETVHQAGDAGPSSERVAELFENSGFVVERIKVVPVPHVKDLQNHEQRTGIKNLIIRHGFGPGPVVALVANADTAPVNGREKHPPFKSTIESGVIYGNGAVCKGNIAAYAFALMALKSANKGLGGTVELHITFDGEGDGSEGVQSLLEKPHVNPDTAIASGCVTNIATSGTGSIELEAEITGRLNGDATKKPNDALFAVSKVLEALFQEKKRSRQILSDIPGIGTAELIVTDIKGERGPRTLPEQACVCFKRTVLPDDDPARIQAQLTRVVGRASVGAKGVVCKVRRLSLAKAFAPNEAGGELRRIIKQQAMESLGRDIAEVGYGGYTDASHYAKRGIPVLLYGVAPETPDLGDDESLNLDNLRKATEVIALGLAEYLEKAYKPAAAS